jgi:hypothetical protein
MGRGRGREIGKGNILLNKLQEERISLVLLLYRSRRICVRHTQTPRANYSGSIMSCKHCPPD